MLKEITFGIKTFKRQNCLHKLLQSIEIYYPKAKIIIVDDDEKVDMNFYKMWKRSLDITLVKMPYDSGLSAGRNKMVELCKTKYFLLLDDDFVFTEETDIEKFYKVIKSDKNIGVVGGCCLENDREVHYEHILDIKNETLYQLHDGNEWEEIEGVKTKKTGCILNFGLFRIDMLKENKWDDKLKLAEHTDFYIRLDKLKKWNVYYTPEVRIIHNRERIGDYKQYRARGTQFSIMMFKKHKIKKQITINGNVSEIKGDKIITYKVF